MLVAGVPLTLRVGFIAGTVGLVDRHRPRFLSGYLGGVVDTVIRMVVDTLLTVPGLLVLIIIAASIKGVINVNLMALVVASLAWMHPTRTIRAQVLTLARARLRPDGPAVGHERARDHRRGDDAQPAAVPRGELRRRGRAARPGLDRPRGARARPAERADPRHDDLLGDPFNALLRGLWWWWVPPIVVIVVLFVGPVPAQRRPRRDRESAAPEGGMIGDRSSRSSDLRVYYHTPRGAVKAVDGVDFSLLKGERFGLVGESGTGKSTTALAIMRMIKPPGMIEAARSAWATTSARAAVGERDAQRFAWRRSRWCRRAR